MFLFYHAARKSILVYEQDSVCITNIKRKNMVDIMSLTKMGGQVALTVTPEDLHHFANALLAQSRKAVSYTHLTLPTSDLV